MDTYQNLCRIFAARERPKRFIGYKQCEEIAEHEATLALKDNDSISFSDVGNIAYTPISFISIEGFMYYLPGLARLAAGSGDEYFMDTFLVHLDNPNRRDAFTTLEKRALSEYLIWLKSVLSESLEANLDGRDLDELIRWLRDG